MKALLTIWLFFALFAQAFAANQVPDSLFAEANMLYSTGRFAEAATLYDSLLKTGYQAAEVYYNLGNAFFKMRQTDKAILNYERAYRLEPADEAIRYNLELARTLTVDKIEALPEFFLTAWWRSVRSWLGSDTWMKISIGAFVIMLLLILWFLFTSRIVLKKILFSFSVILFFVSTLSGIFGIQQRKEFVNRREAIIMVPSVSVKSAPDAGATDLFILHEGTKARIEDAVGGWVEIRISNGNKGWMEVTNLEII